MAKQPNILFLMTDHTNASALAPDSQCRTPNLDAVAADGTRFHRCYTTNAICSPTRASLMTSTYPSTHGMWDCTHTQRREWVDVPADRFTYFSRKLEEAGYTNGYFGKWHVEQSGKLESFGWHEYDTACGGARPEREPGTEVVVPKEGYRDYLLAAVGQDETLDSHPAYDKGIDFIKRKAAGGKPFCCFVSSSEPHDPYIPPRRFFDMMDLESLDLSPTLHDEPNGKPEIIRRMRSVWSDLTDQQWRTVTAAYWAVISFIDHEVGRILDALKEAGAYDDTIIVFTSDHGDMLGAHGLITKGVGTSYEEVYNIPLIVSGPGLRRGIENKDTLTSLVDLAPTLLELCGADPMPVSHGQSLAPILAGRSTGDDRRDAYGEFFGQRFVYTQRITWHENWKYVFSPGGIDELYDLQADPHERHNLADSAQHREVLKDMAARMWRKMRDIGDESLFKTQYATLRTAPVGPNIVDEA